MSTGWKSPENALLSQQHAVAHRHREPHAVLMRISDTDGKRRSVSSMGSVQDAYWYDGGGPWKQFPLAPSGTASLYVGITAVSGMPSSMEVWWTGLSGSVWNAYWYD